MAKILLVEDEETQRARIHHLLTAAGHQVHEATDGLDALHRLEKEHIEIVLTDWSMPNMDGLQLCRCIRSREATHYIHVIFLTSHSEKTELVQAMEAGADDYLSKPAHPAELMVRIRAAERVLSQAAKDVTIFALAKLAESRDPETGHHLERVQSYCKVLARELGFSRTFPEINADFVRLITETSPLHDIGKVAIPDNILQKPGKLTDEEFAIMKTHALYGAETLEAAYKRQPSAEFLKMAAEIAKSHHEKVDGTGYPFGLKGDDIPLSGRIMALADVYDALTSKRCYKAPFDHDKSKSIIVESSGKHFDSRIVDAFLQIDGQFIAIRRKYDEEVV